MTGPDFHDRLDAVLRREIGGVLGLLRAERLSGGASHETYRLCVETAQGERRLALRRAPGGALDRERAIGGPGPRVEARLFEAARAAGVPAPEVHYVLEPADGLGDGFVMEWLDGETFGARIVRSDALAGVRPRLARECGRILGRIHDVDLDASGLRDALERVEPEAYVSDTWQRYQGHDVPQPMIDYSARWLLANLPPRCEPRLVHNDFRNGNLMVTRDGVAAVLDWELAHIGDPMRDLGWLCTSSWRFGGSLPVGGFGTREDLFAGYEAQTGRPVAPAAVHFWEVFGSFWWAVASLEMAQRNRGGPDRSVERAAIGRRSSECQIDCANLLIPGKATPPEPLPPEPLDLPRSDELLASVREHLAAEAANAAGRARFLARVAGNALAIVERELLLGPPTRAAEHTRLRALLGADASLAALRARLCGELRDGRVPIDDAALQAHLRQTAADRIAIDQPHYAGLAALRGR